MKKIIIGSVAALTITTAGVAAYPDESPQPVKVEVTKAVVEEKPDTVEQPTTPDPSPTTQTAVKPKTVAPPPTTQVASPQPSIEDTIRGFLQGKEEEVHIGCFIKLMAQTNQLSQYEERYSYITQKYAVMEYKPCAVLNIYELYGTY